MGFKNKDEQAAYIREWKQLNRDRTRAHKERALAKGVKHIPRPWTAREEALVLDQKMPDKELSHMIDRSIMAIQVRRCRLKGG